MRLFVAIRAVGRCGRLPAMCRCRESKSTAERSKPNVEWTQWGGSPVRNNTPVGHNIPTEWNIGEFDYRTGDWDKSEGRRTSSGSRGSARRPTATRSSPTARCSSARTTAAAGSSAIRPTSTSAACSASTSRTASSSGSTAARSCRPAASTTGRCRASAARRSSKATGCGSSPAAAKSAASTPKASTTARTTARSRKKTITNKDEADVIWVFDMMKELGVSQHNMCSCSLTGAGDVLFVCTSNGVDVEHNYIPAPDAPSFFAMDKNTEKVLWTDNSPGLNILHGQWSSPAYAVLGGVPQVIFGGGDGWLYSFDPEGDGKGNAKLLWKFDCNPKDVVLHAERQGHAQPHHRHAGDLRRPGLRRRRRRSRARRRHRPPVVHRSDEARRRAARSWPSTRKTRTKPIPHKRLQAVVDGRRATSPGRIRTRPSSGTTATVDTNGDGKIDFEETMHRTRRHASRSRTTSSTSPTSAACSTASTPRPARCTGPTTCSPPRGARR